MPNIRTIFYYTEKRRWLGRRYELTNKENIWFGSEKLEKVKSFIMKKASRSTFCLFYVIGGDSERSVFG
jgi:hypothetical protein